MMVTTERRDPPTDEAAAPAAGGAATGATMSGAAGAAPDAAPDAALARGPDPVLLRVVRFMARRTRPLAGRRFFPLWAVLHHRGRRSGREYAAPVGVRATDAGYFIALPFGERTQWVHNVIAAGGCTLRWRGEDLVMADPELVGSDEAAAAFPLVLRLTMRAMRIDRFIRLRRVGALVR